MKPRQVCSNHDLRVGCLVRFHTAEESFSNYRDFLTPEQVEEYQARSERRFMVTNLRTPMIGSNHYAYIRELNDDTQLEGWYDSITFVRVSR